MANPWLCCLAGQLFCMGQCTGTSATVLLSSNGQSGVHSVHVDAGESICWQRQQLLRTLPVTSQAVIRGLPACQSSKPCSLNGSATMLHSVDEPHAGGVLRTAWDVTVSVLSKAILPSPPTNALNYMHKVNTRVALFEKRQLLFFK